MRKVSKSVSTVLAPVVASLADAQASAAALIARIVQSNPEAAQAVALASLVRPARTTRVARSSAPMSEADRAVAAANMSAGFRQTQFRALIDMLGTRNRAEFSVAEIAEKTGIAPYRVRADLQTIANRLADIEKFPGIGYRLAFLESKRGIEQSVVFAREHAKPVAPARRSKAVSVVPVAPVPSEGEAAKGE